MSERPRLHLFEAFGVELEYMIVDDATLDVRPLCDALLADAHRASGEMDGEEAFSDFVAGEMAWSNELVAHVIEFKTNQPAPRLSGLAASFGEQLTRANELLGGRGARILPTAMHPWMDPSLETTLWPHDGSEFYTAFDRIFNCKGHGWSNLQSAHINLPFAGDDEFGRLHAAIRLVLPILPALAASSPICDGRASPWLDTRLEVYRHNCRAIPHITGHVIPEPVFSEEEYHDRIFKPMFEAIAPHDPDGEMREEWLNARGAIARFGRGSIEIRVLDVQECPRADLAIVAAAVGVIMGMVEERWSSFAAQKSWSAERLAQILSLCVRDADAALIADREYLSMFGVKSEGMTAAQLWRSLFDVAAERLGGAADEHQLAWRTLANHGSLARRIMRALGADAQGSQAPIDRVVLREVYRGLADCAARGDMFAPRST